LAAAPATHMPWFIDPTTSSTLYVGTSIGGVFKSTDAGATWQGCNTPLFAEVHALVMDPLTPTTLYAGAFGAGTVGTALFKSTDAGSSWRAFNAGLTSTRVIRFSGLRLDGVTLTPQVFEPPLR
jgi:photosystem II stability/assembly factor-like uncharacterized protein